MVGCDADSKSKRLFYGVTTTTKNGMNLLRITNKMKQTNK